MSEKKNLGIYVHIPFCIRKCSYCDFLSYPVGKRTKADGNSRIKEYLASLQQEIRMRSRECSEYRVNSVFLGGGTPTVLSAVELSGILKILKESFDFEKDTEITMEANPGTVTEELLESFAGNGGNRISFGLQSADDKELKLLGRIHRFSDFEESFLSARKLGIGNINVDLMSALPGQSVENYRSTLEKVLEFSPEHISSYSLIVEEGTPFYETYGKDVLLREKGETPEFLPTEETEREIYHLTEEILNTAGYEHYEISNYAKKGRRCRHNEGCWKRTDYIGFGLGASSFLKNKRMTNIRELSAYIEKNGLSCVEEETILSRSQQMEEVFFLGLRRKDGVSLPAFEEEFHIPAEEVFGQVMNRYRDMGYLKIYKERVAFTKKGWDVANYILSEFLIS